MFFVHLGVAVDALYINEALFLDLACLHYPFADDGAGLSGRGLGNLFKVEGHYLALQVYAVHQRAGNAVQIALNLSGAAYACFCGVVVIAARARVHAGNEHERTGIADAVLGAVDVDGAVLQRLSEHFQYGALEFGQLVEEQHTVMGQGNLARLWVLSSADEGDRRDGVMRTAEGALGNERALRGQASCHGMNLCGFQAFL